MTVSPSRFLARATVRAHQVEHVGISSTAALFSPEHRRLRRVAGPRATVVPIAAGGSVAPVHGR